MEIGSPQWRSNLHNFMENLLKKLEDLRERINKTWILLDMDEVKSKVKSQKLKMNAPDFWENREEAVKILKEVEDLEKEVIKWEEFIKEVRELEEFVAFAQHEAEAVENEADTVLHDEMQLKLDELEAKFQMLEFTILFSGPYDRSQAILSIHAGTGGTDAQDWAEILMRMYLRFAEKKSWKPEIIEYTGGNEAGIKSMTMRIPGLWAYGNLRSENGVHRLVRISPFDAEAMRHTLFALVEVIPELPEAEDLEIKDDEIRIDVYRASGPGGQGVNTTDSAVRIVHLPSGITVTCQSERSQHQNKDNALKILKAKLFKVAQEEKKAEESRMRGENQKAEWGKQIRSYVMQPYQMVKDHRTEFETSDIKSVLDGSLDGFIEAYLRKNIQ